MRTLARQVLVSVRALLVLTAVLGLIYPLLILGVGRVFAGNADGSLVTANGTVIGSDLIGQSFTDLGTGRPLPQYFQSRPGAYDPTASGASNLGPEDEKDQDGRPSLLTDVCARSAAVGAADGVDGGRPSCEDGRAAPGRGGPAGVVPPDAVTGSGSGLDPHISPAYARLQVARVAEARRLPDQQVRDLVEQQAQGRTLGFLGEPRVNVLELNLALDRLGPRD